MSREIKFRGLTKEGKWVYGWYCEGKYGGAYILTSVKLYHCNCNDICDCMVEAAQGTCGTEVIPETVGQFINLHDRNHKEIYGAVGEKGGDIVRLMTSKAHYKGEKNKYRIEIVTKGCSCGLNTNGLVSIQKEGQEEYEPQLEVIGNQAENPELMEKAK